MSQAPDCQRGALPGVEESARVNASTDPAAFQPAGGGTVDEGSAGADGCCTRTRTDEESSGSRAFALLPQALMNARRPAASDAIEASAGPVAEPAPDAGEDDDLEEPLPDRLCSLESLVHRLASMDSAAHRIATCLLPGGRLATANANEKRRAVTLEGLNDLADAVLADKFAVTQSRRRSKR